MHIAVVGGGAAGIFAAYGAAKLGADVTLFDGNEKIGKKLFLTGKGRCNLTNASDIDRHIANVLRNPRFLYSAYRAFSPEDVMALVERQGTPLKIERGDRVFPQSDKSSDILAAFNRLLRAYKVKVRLSEKVLEIRPTEAGFRLITEKGEENCDRVILCTGGISYRATGSTGDGYRFAGSFGHSITELRPSLIGLRAQVPCELAGLSLKNVSLSVRRGGKELASEFGEMLFTHSGISGPIVLTISAQINRMALDTLAFALDLKPALSQEVLDARLIREFSAGQNKEIKNVLPNLMPRSLISFVLAAAKIGQDLPCHSVTKAQRKALVAVMKDLPICVTDFEDPNSAIITSGGVDTSEVDPKTMESKKQKGLYFAGELLDLDALTGGYNLQIAFSTGYLAGISAANACEK